MNRPELKRGRYQRKDSEVVLSLLRVEPRSITAVADALDADPGNTYRRMHRLQAMGLVRVSGRLGRRVLWSAVTPQMDLKSADAPMDGTT